MNPTDPQTRRSILLQLAANELDVDAAERALDALGGPAAPRKIRHLVVRVNSESGDNVNVRVPLALVRTGIKLSSMLPAGAQEKLRTRGLDLSGLAGLDPGELDEALATLQVEVDGTNGDTVRVFCE